MYRKNNIFTTEIFPKKHDWLLSAFSVLLLVALGLLSMPSWRLSALLFYFACIGLTDLEKRFGGRPSVPVAAMIVAGTVIVCVSRLVRTGRLGEDSTVMVATAFGLLGVIAIRCATVIHRVLTRRHSTSSTDSHD